MLTRKWTLDVLEKMPASISVDDFVNQILIERKLKWQGSKSQRQLFNR